MAELQAVQDGTYDRSKGPPRIAREFIHQDDYHGLIDLLVAIGRELPDADPAADRIEKLWEKTKGVLGRDIAKPSRASGVSPRKSNPTAPAKPKTPKGASGASPRKSKAASIPSRTTATPRKTSRR